MSNEKGVKKKHFWKGKLVTEKVYKSRMRMVAVGKNLRKVCGSKDPINLTVPEVKEKNEILEGRRIIDLKTLANELICKKCGVILSLMNAESEERKGLASIFTIKCQNCRKNSRVVTDTVHIVTNPKCKKKETTHFDVNTRVSIGVLNSGCGNSHLNTILAAMNIPPMYNNSYKVHEREVGDAMEKLAFDSCEKATILERELSIQNAEKLKVSLPPNLKENFLLPNPDHIDGKISEKNIVRIAASFDMGWTTRGTGRSYDSLTGSAALIGYFSKKVLSYVTKNRKCRMCDRGHGPMDHDCRKNFEGTAKSMEPKAASELAANNKIFENCNVELGIVISDNDSSSILSMREPCNHDIVKHADKNHTSKGVTNELYKIKKNYKELTSEAIKYLQRCFSYCISQNIGNQEGMEKAIKNIPFHCFNIHENCGSWCGYLKDSENYKHLIIGSGFTDQRLFQALQSLFQVLANKSNRFVAGASSNANESLNTVIASKAPKSRMYGTTASGDYRVACAITKKNNGESFIIDLEKNLGLPPGKHSEIFSTTKEKYARQRYVTSTMQEFKKRRLFLKKKKTNLRKKKEIVEGSDTYRSNMGLINRDAPILVNYLYPTTSPIPVLFDLETSGFAKTAEILQIAATCNNSTFSVYITPNRVIDHQASDVTGLRFDKGQLLYYGKVVDSVSLYDAMCQFYNFLCTLKRKCILVAHNSKFDAPRLITACQQTYLLNHFKAVVEGFCDTLPIIKKLIAPEVKNYTLQSLADYYKIDATNAHNAITDVVILEQILKKLGVNESHLISHLVNWEHEVEKKKYNDELPDNLRKLNALSTCNAVDTRKKMIAAKISYEMILDVYKKHKLFGLRDLFGEDDKGNIAVTKSSKVINKIVCYLENVNK